MSDAAALRDSPGGGPRACPEYRNRIIKVHNQEHVRSRLMAARRVSEVMYDHALAELALSDLYWISPDMCDLVSHAAQTVPLSAGLPEDMLDRPSIAFLGKRWWGTTSSHPELGPVPVWAIQWYGVNAYSPEWGTPWPEVHIDSYGFTATAAGGGLHVQCGGSAWPRDVALGNVGEGLDEQETASTVEDRRWLVALLSILHSPGIATQHVMRPDRATTRRLARAESPPADVRVIYLRTALGSSEPGGGESNYHHRWIVDGHWRQQPCGPGGKLRRLTWIAPYVKGPEGAPLLVSDKVRALVR